MKDNIDREREREGGGGGWRGREREVQGEKSEGVIDKMRVHVIPHLICVCGG